MSTRRTARVASVIREVVSTAILQELRDPRIRHVTVLGVEVSSDLRYATVSVSVMGSDKDVSLTMHGLNSARGYLQSKVAGRVKTRYTPELRFEIDEGIRKSFEATRILQEVLPESTEEDSSSAGDEPSGESETIEESAVEQDTSTPGEFD